MKIATWNVERLKKTRNRLSVIIDYLNKINADILVLTETDEIINLDYPFIFHSSKPKESFYKEGEKRASIFSKYKPIEQFETFRDDTSICTGLATPFGALAIYGTIIGIDGSRRKDFIEDLNLQLLDFEKIGKKMSLCICGDLNISFSDNYYFTQDGRQKLNDSFNKLELENQTASIANNIDHIVLAKVLLEKRK